MGNYGRIDMSCISEVREDSKTPIVMNSSLSMKYLGQRVFRM